MGLGTPMGDLAQEPHHHVLSDLGGLWAGEPAALLFLNHFQVPKLPPPTHPDQPTPMPLARWMTASLWTTIVDSQVLHHILHKCQTCCRLTQVTSPATSLWDSIPIVKGAQHHLLGHSCQGHQDLLPTSAKSLGAFGQDKMAPNPC